jgi:ATP-dependent Clp protease ATP-binding subunit ClpA
MWTPVWEGTMTEKTEQTEPRPYTDPVTVTELEPYDPASDNGSAARQTAVAERSIVEIVEGAAEEPKAVFKTASVLARMLNDERVRVPHLMLALTLTPRGIERLSNYGLPKDAIRRTSWDELVPSDPPSSSVSAPVFSENVANIVRLAEKKANAERTEHMSVDDLVEVISTTPLRERYQHYWVVQARPDPIQQILLAVATTDKKVDGLIVAQGKLLTSQDKVEKGLTRAKYLLQLTVGLTSLAAAFVVGVGTTLLLRFLSP